MLNEFDEYISGGHYSKKSQEYTTQPVSCANALTSANHNSNSSAFPSTYAIRNHHRLKNSELHVWKDKLLGDDDVEVRDKQLDGECTEHDSASFYDLASDVLTDKKKAQCDRENDKIRSAADKMAEHLKNIRLRRQSNFTGTLKQITRTRVQNKKPAAPLAELNALAAKVEEEKSVKGKVGALFGDGAITPAARNIQRLERKARYSLTKVNAGFGDDNKSETVNNDDTLAIQYMNTGLRYENNGDYSQAVRNYRRAHVLRLNKYGASHEYTVEALKALQYAEEKLEAERRSNKDRNDTLSRHVSMKIKSRVDDFEREVQAVKNTNTDTKRDLLERQKKLHHHRLHSRQSMVRLVVKINPQLHLSLHHLRHLHHLHDLHHPHDLHDLHHLYHLHQTLVKLL